MAVSISSGSVSARVIPAKSYWSSSYRSSRSFEINQHITTLAAALFASPNLRFRGPTVLVPNAYSRLFQFVEETGRPLEGEALPLQSFESHHFYCSSNMRFHPTSTSGICLKQSQRATKEAGLPSCGTLFWRYVDKTSYLNNRKTGTQKQLLHLVTERLTC